MYGQGFWGKVEEDKVYGDKVVGFCYSGGLVGLWEFVWVSGILLVGAASRILQVRVAKWNC